MTPRSRYHCCDQNRRNAVSAHPSFNGLDALEVIDRDLPELDPLRQRTLLLYCLKPIDAAGFNRDNVHLEGGERIRNPAIEWAAAAMPWPAQLNQAGEAATAAIIAALPEPDRVLVVRVAQPGDYARYTVRLQSSGISDAPPQDFDPRMVEIDFSFKVECPSDFDCQPTATCQDESPQPPQIDYLARDYSSLRRLLMDRLSLQVPTWRALSPADGGVALVELLAYVGDHLSYRQDAVATEAYLGTARQRVSLRRHAQLVDYAMHDGCNARCFVQLELDAGSPPLLLPRRGTRFLTRCDRLGPALQSGSRDELDALRQQPVVFEPLHALTLHAAHNMIRFYTWGDARCCLPQGATRATLRGWYPNLKVGDWLVLEEVRSPTTGLDSDADPAHRQVVRLTLVESGDTDELPTPAVQITHIAWASEDALRFALCLTAQVTATDGKLELIEVSVARGNTVLADHGMTLPPESLGHVPPPSLFRAVNPSAHCDPQSPVPVPPRFRPSLAQGPVTQAAPADLLTSAAAAWRQDLGAALPQITLACTLDGDSLAWKPRRSLLNSHALDTHFVAEVAQGDTTTLRFGDDNYGQRPKQSAAFTATYRVGNGRAGNVGTDSLVHVLGVDVSAIKALRNPLAAQGGIEPESMESVRRRAPEAFRTQERAVTPADYASKTERHPGVQRAAARMRWTGSWHTVFVTVDQTGGAPLDTTGRHRLTAHLDRYRMAGHDLAFEAPEHVSLALGLHVCVAPDYFRSDVRSRLESLFSNRAQPNGQPGLFHPDNFSFGQTVYLSRLVAAAQSLPGVASLSVLQFGRQGDVTQQALQDGLLTLGPREIARLDNDPNYPEHGTLTLSLHGGK